MKRDEVASARVTVEVANERVLDLPLTAEDLALLPDPVPEGRIVSTDIRGTACALRIDCGPVQAEYLYGTESGPPAEIRPLLEAIRNRNLPPPISRRPILAQEWTVIAVAGAISAAAAFQVGGQLAREGGESPLQAVELLAGIVQILAHAMWISLDRRRRGLPIGWWRFWAIFIPPLAVLFYLMMEYRVRALGLIPLYGALYAVTWLIPAMIGYLAAGGLL